MDLQFIYPPALPTKSSLSFVVQNLLDNGVDTGIFAQQLACVERLGGQASTLEM